MTRESPAPHLAKFTRDFNMLRALDAALRGDGVLVGAAAIEWGVSEKTLHRYLTYLGAIVGPTVVRRSAHNTYFHRYKARARARRIFWPQR